MAGNNQLLYLDSSALVKLIRPQPETEALLDYLSDWPDLITSDIARVEVQRAARRVSRKAEVLKRTEKVLESVHLITMTRDILEAAAQLKPHRLRSLDAIHLATSIDLRDDLGGFVAYDQALLEAARSHELITESPA